MKNFQIYRATILVFYLNHCKVQVNSFIHKANFNYSQIYAFLSYIWDFLPCIILSFFQATLMFNPFAKFFALKEDAQSQAFFSSAKK